MNLYTKLAIGLTAAALALGTTACNYDISNTKLEIIDKLYSSLPVEVQGEYASEIFMESSYDVQASTIKEIVDSGGLSYEDNVYIGISSMMQLSSEIRTAAIQSIIDDSDYNVQREVTFYGLKNLNSNDSFQVIKNSGQNILSDFGEKVKDAYDLLFGGN